jgi:DNA-binding CsgD family transcriptional regulator
LAELAAEAEIAHDVMNSALGLAGQGIALASQGKTGAARAASDAAVDATAELGGLAKGLGYIASTITALAAGDAELAQDASEKAGGHWSVLPAHAPAQRMLIAQAALASGELTAARRVSDAVIPVTKGWWLIGALTTRTRVAIAQGEPEQAERDAHDALAIAADIEAYLFVPDTLECLAALAGDGGDLRQAARLFGASESIRQRAGEARFKVWDTDYQASVTALRNAMSDKAFDEAWAEGAALSLKAAIAYAQRGRGQRKRPTSGWASLTPTERQVVQLLSEGLANNDIAARLFISPRTVQTHLTHVYTKLGLTSRVQLAQEAARHA